MTKAEDLVRSTTAAIASTVRDVPPLRLEAALELPPGESRAPGHHPPGRVGRSGVGRSGAGRWRPWLAPVAAGIAIVALALGLVLVKGTPTATTAPSATPKHVAMPKGIPQYYVAWTQAARPGIVVGDTVTGAIVARWASPSGVRLTNVYGTANDDRTFVVTGERTGAGDAGAQWYLIRITPGGKPSTRMTPLPIPVRQQPAGVALSPDGTRLAVALSGTPAVLRVYSVATGALLRSWSAPKGQFAAVKGELRTWPYTEMALRWSPDGQQLAFTWNAIAIRSVTVTAPNGSLLASSPTLAGLGTGYTPGGTSVTCNAYQGWNLVDGAQGWAIICGGGWQKAVAPGLGTGKCTSGHPVTFDIDRQGPYGTNGSENTHLPQPQVTECSNQVRAGDGAYIGWSNSDGTVIIGSLLWDGHSRFGIFHGNSFTPLPPLPISMPARAGLLQGTDAW